ncbi:hypothetical protein LX97_01030 [Nonlabens dokdonensis]|uniref:LPXTG cell wall anchor domain-containing protein n=2 Tax=Nonlabens dokdonensis TaxID=328515 RepID=L7W979_NONDD|nr:hypothetical protein [Nonlabens dokdonensis]AGC76366.1 hypothetical protein DDD_1239 [Nonlabens dokdonensis DSW-6]PZX44024.1 hypothetical protein LX97_01030 [Nonlabens dokdonensis]
MHALLLEDSTFLDIIGFLGGSGLFLVLGILLIIVVIYNKYKRRR